FDSSTAKPAAQLCIDRGWLAATAEFEGKGKSRKELYRITPSGIRAALENSEPVKLLTAATGALEQSGKELGALGAKIDALRGALQNHTELVTELRKRLQPPDLDGLLRKLSSATPA